MDEEERKRKLLAGKEKLAQYQRKKGSLTDSGAKVKKKKLKEPKPEDPCSTNAESETQSSEEKAEVPQQSLQTGEMCGESEGFSLDMTSALESLPPEMQDVAETLADAAELDSPQLIEQNVNLPKIEEYNKKLQEYHAALTQRNAVISQLTERLRIIIEQRDKLQDEASTQADTVAREIETLKLQLQQANEFLLNQKGKNGISAQELLEAKNQAIALQQANLQKDATIENMRQNLTTSKSDLDGFQKELHDTAAQLKLRGELIQERDSENRNLSALLQHQLSEKEKLLHEAKHFEEEWLSSKKACQDLQNEMVVLQERLKQSEEDNLTAQQKHQEELVSFSNELLTSKKLLEKNKIRSSDEVKALMEQLENIHKKAAYSDMEGKVMGQQLDTLRAELDEQYGNQIVEMKQEITRVHQSDLEKLKTELADVAKEKEELLDRLYGRPSASDEGISKGADFSATLSLSPNASFSSEVELWQEKARLATNEKESLESTFKTQLNFVNENVQTLIEENRALKLSYSEAAQSLKEKNALIENMTQTLSEKDAQNEEKATIEMISSERRALGEEFKALECDFRTQKGVLEALKLELEETAFHLDKANSKDFQHRETLARMDRELGDAKRANADLQHQLENEVQKKLNAIEDHERLKSKFDSQVEELRLASQQFSEMKIYLDDLGSEKQSDAAELTRLKQELLLKNKLFDNVQEKLGMAYKQLNELQQQREELERVYNVEADQRDTDWDISINFGDVVRQFNELRTENERLRAMVSSGTYGEPMVVCANIDVSANKSLVPGRLPALEHSEMLAAEEVDWKSKYDSLLQEKLELEIELPTTHMDTGMIAEQQKGYDMPMLTDEAGGESSTPPGKSPLEYLVNQLMESSSSMEMMDKSDAVEIAERSDLPSLREENEFLKTNNSLLHEEAEKQKSSLSELLSLMNQETELRVSETENNKMLLADLTAVQDEIANFKCRCEDAEAAQALLEARVCSLQETCDAYKKKADESDKSFADLNQQLISERLDHRQVVAELQAAEAELTKLGSQIADDSTIEEVKSKLQSMINIQESQGIVVKSSYVLGGSDEAKDFHAQEEKSKLEQLLNEIEHGAKGAGDANTDLSASSQEMASLQSRLQDVETAKIKLEAAITELQEKCSNADQKLVQMEQENKSLVDKLHAEQAKVCDVLIVQQQVSDLRASLQSAESAKESLQATIDDLQRTCDFNQQKVSQLDEQKSKLEGTVNDFREASFTVQQKLDQLEKHNESLTSQLLTEQTKVNDSLSMQQQFADLRATLESAESAKESLQATISDLQQTCDLYQQKASLLEEQRIQLEGTVNDLRTTSFAVQQQLVQLEKCNELLTEQLLAAQTKVGDSLSVQQQMADLCTNLESVETAKEFLQKTVDTLQQKCNFHEQNVVQREADFTTLQSQLHVEELRHQATLAELQTVKDQQAMGEILVPEESVDALRHKLEKAVEEQEKQAISVTKAYVVGGNRHSGQQNKLLMMQEETERLKTRLQHEEEARMALETANHDLVEKCTSYEEYLGESELREAALRTQLAKEQIRYSDVSAELQAALERSSDQELADGDIVLRTEPESNVMTKAQEPITAVDGLISPEPEVQGQKCDLQRLINRLQQKAGYGTEGDFVTLQQELSNLETRLQNDGTIKATLESSVSNLQKMCDVYEQKLNQLVADCDALERQLRDERRGHQKAVSELNRLRESQPLEGREDVESLRSRLEAAVARQEMNAIKVQTAFVLGTEDQISASQSMDPHLETPVSENAVLMQCLEKERQTNAHLLNELKRLRTSCAADDGCYGEATASAENAFTSSEIETPRKKKKKVQFAEDEDRFPRASDSDDFLSQDDEIEASHLPAEDKSDAIKCECHESAAKNVSRHGSGDFSEKDEKQLLAEKFIEATAETVSQAALERAQNQELDLQEAKSELERQYEELVKNLQENHAAELESQAKELTADFQLMNGHLAAQLEDQKSKLLQDILEMNRVLKDTEANLQSVQLRLEEEMQLRTKLEGEFSAKIENEKALLQQRIADLDRQLQQKDEAEVSLREELQTQYEEDVEEVRKCLEVSLSHEAQVTLEAQANMEAEVDLLKEKVEADILARNEENSRLSDALQELKAQVEQLQADKRRLERMLSSEPTDPDDLLLELDDKEFLPLAGSAYRRDWEQSSNASDDTRNTSSHLKQLLNHLVGIYVKLAKTVNKELINLLGTDLGVCEITLSGDGTEASKKSVKESEMASRLQLESFAFADLEGPSPNTSVFLAHTEGSGDRPFQDMDLRLEDIVTETSEKLTVAVQRLLGMLGASLMQLQESHAAHTELANTSLQSNDNLAELAAQNEELSSQMNSEMQTKECLAVELHKLTGLLKSCEVEKGQLEDTLARKERQLEQVVCQLEDAQAENERLQDSLIEDQKQLKFHQEVIAEGIGEHAQMVKSVRTEPLTHLLATGGTELLEENTRLQHEKRGLQHRGEKDRSHLMGRIQELEQTLEEITTSHDAILEEKRQEITDLQQQIDAIDKQLRGYKQFIEEQTAEREQEREEFQLEMNRLREVLREKDKAKNSEEQLAREVDALQHQIKKNEKLKQQAKEKQEQLERDLENLAEKSNHQQDLIRELERQLDCKSRNEKDLGEQMEELKDALNQTSKVNEDQSQEIEELRKMSISSHISTTIPFLEECLDIHGLELDGPSTPESIMLELRTQIHSLEDKVCRHARDLEGLNITSSSLSSPCSEEVSVREQLDALRSIERGGKSTGVEPSFSAYLQDVRRLEEKVEALTRGRDVVLKRMKDLEAHALKQKQVEEELQQDREVLQQKVNEQLIQISGLQARIEERRLGVHSNEVIEKIHLLQEELLKEKEVADKKGKQLKILQAEYSQSQEQCVGYKNQVSSLLQQYNDDVSQNKVTQAAASLENNELKQHNLSLKGDLEKSKQRSEELSSLLQTVMKEKNEEMDLLTAQLNLAEEEKEQLKELTAKQDEEIKCCQKTLKEERQRLAYAEEALEEKTLELQEKEDGVKQAEKETRRAWETVEQKKREVDALKVVLEEKAQLVEQVKTLQVELDDLTQYQARLQEDFDTVQAMLEERQQDLAELTIVRDASLEEQVNLRNQIDVLQKQLISRQCESFDVSVQVNEEGKDRLLSEDYVNELLTTKAAQEEQLQAVKKEFTSVVALHAECEKQLVMEKQAVNDANKSINDALRELQMAQEKSDKLAAELEELRCNRKPSGDELQATKDALNKTEQLKSRLEAEIAWRDTKIFRLEDEVEQIKTNISRGLQTNDGKSALQKFLEEVQNEVAQEFQNENNENMPSDASRRRTRHLSANGNGFSKEVVWSGDEGPLTSTDASISGSDADSTAGDSVPPHIKSLMRKVYKDGLHLLNLSEIHALQEHTSNDPSAVSIQKDILQKAWANEKSHLIAEIQALKDLLSQVTTIAAASRVQSPIKSSCSSQTLHFISNLLTKERDNLLAQVRSGLISSGNADLIDVRKLDKSITELNSLYNSLLESIQKIKITVDDTSQSQLNKDSKATLWEVQMAVAKERLKHQEDQKKLMQQLHAVDQQLAQCERQAKRQVELLEFRAQQEQIIADDLRRSLDLEKSRSIELCSQLALEKGRASHLELNMVQLKSELGNYQMSLEQERQESCNLMQQFKNEKARAEALVQALQGERDSFAQLQEAMEAEKRRSKASHHREQQIIAELRQALETERDKQLELTAALEHEKLALQNARQDLGRTQRRTFEARMQTSSNTSMCLSDDGQMHDESEISSQSTLDDVQEALELEKRKNQDLGSVLQREHNRITLLTTALQQERRQLLDEIEGDRNNIGQLQATIEMLQAQKGTLQKELKREKEQVHRLEADQNKMASDLSTVRSEVHQRDQEIQALRQIQRDLHKDWEVEREHERHRQRETQLELQRLQQKFVIHEKEIEFLQRNEALLKQELSEERKLISLTKGQHLVTSKNAASRYQHASLETVRERLYLLLLKAQDELDHLFPKHSQSPFANTLGALLIEVANLGQETLLSPQAPEGFSHLDLTERIVRHNADLVRFAIQQSEEKLSLRKASMQPRENSVVSGHSRSSIHSQSQVSHEQVVAAERAAWAQERSSLLRALHRAEAELVRASGEARASRQSRSVMASPVSRVDEGKTSVYYFKYLRAQSFRKNLMYQKNYLLILLGGYQDTEAATLEMLGRLGCLSSAYGGHHHLQRSKAFRKFRSTVRVITSVVRMKVLVRKWNSRTIHAGFPPYHDRQERDDGGFDILSNDTASAIRVPSIHSQYHSFYPGYTPPVRDNIRSHTDSERSFSPVARRSLSLRTGSTSSTSSNHSITPLTEYVHRFDSIQQQLGIRNIDVGVISEMKD